MRSVLFAFVAALAAQVAQASPISPAETPTDIIMKRDGDCTAEPGGAGTAIHSPDTAAAFTSSPIFSTAALAASAPVGYTVAFTNLQAATTTSSYMGFMNLNTYSPTSCAAICKAATGCVGFNLFFERDPSLNPNAVSCPNPASITNIKCSLWGVAITLKTATNVGEMRDSFHVVIAGSNGYNLL